MLTEGTIVTLVMLGGGLIAQAAYLKGIFSKDIENNKINIKLNFERLSHIDERLESGKDAFQRINENTAMVTTALRTITAAMDKVVYKDTCEAVARGHEQRLARLERVKNGNGGV